MDKKHLFFEILTGGDVGLFFSPRTISSWVSKVFPIPQGSRRGRPSKIAIPPTAFENLIPIPGIISEGGGVINFPMLRFALISISQFLKKSGWTIDQVIQSEIFKFYANAVHPFLRDYSKIWVHQVFLKNSSIFTL